MSISSKRSRLGMTVMPEEFLGEGIEKVLDRLRELSITSVTTCPYVAEKTDEASGEREPPIDGGNGKVRFLERRLWGEREVWVRTSPSFKPTASLYRHSLYKPGVPDSLTETMGQAVNTFLAAAKTRGMTTYLQLMTAMPPSYRVQVGGPLPKDEPRLPDGSIIPARTDRNATLASSNLRSYLRGLIQDLCQHFPEVDGFRFDWPEYPPYHFLSLLADYNPQVEPYAQEIGIDFQCLKKHMRGLCPFEPLKVAIEQDVSLEEFLNENLAAGGALAEHFLLRRHLVLSMARFLKEIVDEASQGSKHVMLQGFPPPWHRLSGFDAAALATHVDEIAIKFYTMHWSMIGANYIRSAARMLDIPEKALTRYFRKHFLDQNYDLEKPLTYPGPEDRHGVTGVTLQKRMRQIGVAGALGLTHTYGPIEDVVERFEALYQATGGRVELNRYAFVSDEKFAALSQSIERLASVKDRKVA